MTVRHTLPIVMTVAKWKARRARLRRGGRAVDGSGLENRQGASPRGFESHPLRQVQELSIVVDPTCNSCFRARRFERSSPGEARYAPGLKSASAGSLPRAKAQLWIIPPLRHQF